MAHHCSHAVQLCSHSSPSGNLTSLASALMRRLTGTHASSRSMGNPPATLACHPCTWLLAWSTCRSRAARRVPAASTRAASLAAYLRNLLRAFSRAAASALSLAVSCFPLSSMRAVSLARLVAAALSSLPPLPHS